MDYTINRFIWCFVLIYSMNDVITEYFTEKKLFCLKHPNIMCDCERKHNHDTTKTKFKLCEDHYMEYEEYVDDCNIITKICLKVIGWVYPKNMPIKLPWYNISLCTICTAMDEDNDDGDTSSLCNDK